MATALQEAAIAREQAENAQRQAESARRKAIPRLQELGLSYEQIASVLNLSIEEVEAH